MIDLAKFSFQDMTSCGVKLRGLAKGSQSMEDAAGRIVSWLYDELQDGTSGQPACVLARLYKTHPFGRLPLALQTFAGGSMPNVTLDASVKCLSLLGTKGARPDWCAREKSQGHQAIPLPSAAVVESLPMIAQLVRQLGIETTALLSSDKQLLVDLQEKTFNVFHVGDAKGSPYVPAQAQFVEAFGVESVVGFGGLLPDGELFAVILFTRLPVPRDTAELFRTLSLNVKMALLPFANRVFAG